MRRRLPSLIPGLALALLAGHALPATPPVAEARLVATPRAKPLPASATNLPFLAAARAEQPVDLAAAGYTESELLVSGVANVYDWPVAAGMPLQVRGAEVPYTTRILLRRPADLRKFSGLVVVELLDAGDLYDRAPLWGLSWQQFLRHGDAWVGVTVRPAAMAALRRFDPVRYGPLSFNYRQPASCHAAAGDLRANPPDAEGGLAWDVVAQVGALLRSASKENPLQDLHPRFLVAAGYGLAGAELTTYANALHAALRLGDAAPVYDGYLAAADASLQAPINQCAPPLPADDPRRGALPRDVPFVSVMTESDFNLAPALRRADSDAPGDVFRLYEIPGAAHDGPYLAGMPPAADLQIAGIAAAPAQDLCADPPGDFPAGLAFNAIWEQYAEWLASGRPLPDVPRIDTLPDGSPRRDEHGNASGGWRLPQLEVPLAQYAGRSAPRMPGEQASAACALTGTTHRLDAPKLKSLYRNRTEYLKRLRAAVDHAVAERLLTSEDGEVLSNPKNEALPAF